ncbi:MAG: 3'-5' exonuclease, partial [Desulfovibrio sp.]|nr:3'-5' exonuclease [Desulfovibrio sp.]
MKLLCFDAEFADRQEILELSIWEATGEAWEKRRQVFHQYVKPRTCKRWPGSQRVHHISPQMVADKPYFSRWRATVQKLMDEADFIVGFDIGNDIGALAQEGIKGLEKKRVVDVRDFHWMVNTLAQGVPLNSRKGLQATAEELGVPFSENLAHGADYDTRITLDCFLKLIEQFHPAAAKGIPGITGNAGVSDDSDNADVPTAASGAFLDRYLVEWEETLDRYQREFARGWVFLQKWKDGYRVKALQADEPAGPDVAETIRVCARYRALDEIDRRVRLVREQFKGQKCLKLRWHEPAMSHLEGILSRAGREMADVVELAWRKGALFDSWMESFD